MEHNRSFEAGWTTLLVAVIALALLLAVARSGHGATASFLRSVEVEFDAFLNYDFLEEEHTHDGVDWAMSIVFWNNSSVDSVKRVFPPVLQYHGSAMNAYMKDNEYWDWDSDEGIKELPLVIFGDNLHMRIYGPALDSGYNDKWGYYNIASTHVDHNEGNPIGEWAGMSEVAESEVADLFEIWYGEETVDRDAFYMQNLQIPVDEDGHHWENDGFATKLRMPSTEEEINGGLIVG